MSSQHARINVLTSALIDVEALTDEDAEVRDILERKIVEAGLPTNTVERLRAAAVSARETLRRDRSAIYRGYRIRYWPGASPGFQVFPPVGAVIVKAKTFDGALDWIDEHPLEETDGQEQRPPL